MKAGCIAKQHSKDKKITSVQENLCTVFGLPLNVSEEIDFKRFVVSSKFSVKDEIFLSVEIKNFFLVKELSRSASINKTDKFPQF